MPTTETPTWEVLRPTLTRLQVEVVEWCAQQGREPYDAAREGLCGSTIITRWGAHTVRTWIAAYRAAHPDPAGVRVQIATEVSLMVPPALAVIRDTVSAGGATHTPLRVRTAQWVVSRALDLGTASAGGRDDAATSGDERELAQVLTLVQD